MSRRAELLLWVSGTLLIAIAGAHLLAYSVFQSDPVLFQALAKTHSSALSRTPLFRLQIPRIQMNLAVLEGDDEDTLSLGPGHVPDSASVGTRGNAVIAGHRDLAFRDLRFVKPGDRIVVAGTHDYQYVVTGVRIVMPDDISALAQTPEPQLTLITCYPFYFVGNAPRRFVVQAKRVS